MRKTLTIVMILFMTLGPVASFSAQVSAQVNSIEWISSDTSLDKNLEEPTEGSIQQLAQTNTQHSCCDETKCSCSYQNECDIQNLTFFALSKPQPQLLAPIESASITTAHSPSFHASQSSSIYRPPII